MTVAPVSVTQSDGALLQRKPNCACGGGCPSCQRDPHPETIQTKLQVSTPGDQYEQEADRVAEQVMRMPNSMLQRQCNACSDVSAPSAGDEEKPRIQRLAKGAGGTAEIAADFTKRLGAGVPLDAASRSYFEPRFGHDFGNVRIHNGPQADKEAASVQARAFTLGRDVAFAAGEHDPGSESGKRLLAHELTHVVQQQASFPSLQLKPLTEEEKKENLKSPRFAGNERLQKAFDNDPIIRKGEEDQEAVKILQKALIDDLCPIEIALSPDAASNCAKAIMPVSTKEGTEPPDGIFGDETFITVQKFQMKYGLLDDNGLADGKLGRKTLGKLDELFPAPKAEPPRPEPPGPEPEIPTSKGKFNIEINPIIATGSRWDTDPAQLGHLAPRVDFAKKTWKKLASIEINDRTPTKDSRIPSRGIKSEDQASLAGKLGGTNRLIIVLLTDQCCQDVPDPILPFLKHTMCPDAITKQGPPPSVCMAAKNTSLDSVLGHEMGHVFLRSGDHFPNGLMQISDPYPDTLNPALIIRAQAFFLTP